LEGDVLAGLELRQRPAVMRCEVKGVNVLAFANLFNNLKLSITIPDQFDLLDFFGAGFGDLDFRFEPLACERLLLAFESKPAKSAVAERGRVESQEAEQQITEEQPGVPPKYILHLLYKGLHF
jgi:hypothetical protein